MNALLFSQSLLGLASRSFLVCSSQSTMAVATTRRGSKIVMPPQLYQLFQLAITNAG